jgi:hypothetical protein
VEKRSSTFEGADAKVRRSFWASGKEFCKPTAIRLYNHIGGPKLVHVVCWAHARRKFVDAVKVNPQDAAAVKMVTRMDVVVFGGSPRAAPGVEHEQRLALRREHAESWAEEIRLDPSSAPKC